MGTVIQWSDVVAKYRDAGSAGDANTMNASYILPSESYVKGSLFKRYSNALTDAGELIKDLIIDEAYRRMLLVKQPKKAEALKKDIKTRIDDIVKGNVSLYDSSGDILYSDNTLLWSNTDQYIPTFGVGDVTDMEVDQDQINDEDDERD